MQCHGQQSPKSHRVLSALLTACVLTLDFVGVPGVCAQASSDSQAAAGAPAPPKAPALLNTTGPDITLQNSEALFDIAAALNACGYDQGLAASDPVRQQVREQVNQALQGSSDARDARDQLCTFIDSASAFR